VLTPSKSQLGIVITKDARYVHVTATTTIAEFTVTVTAGHVVATCGSLNRYLTRRTMVAICIAFQILSGNPLSEILVTTLELLTRNVRMPGSMTLETPF